MSSCCSRSCAAIEGNFDARVAERDLADYRKKGAGATAILLLDGIAASGGAGATLLDVGGGIGALSFELLERGATRAVIVDASAAYIAAGRGEAERRQRGAQIEWLHGDYVALAASLPPADTVTLDRAVCCDRRFEAVLNAAAGQARRCLALSYPRDRWYVRLGQAGENALRALRGSEFRVFLHPPERMQQLIESHGFALAARRTTAVWCADVYRTH